MCTALYVSEQDLNTLRKVANKYLLPVDSTSERPLLRMCCSCGLQFKLFTLKSRFHSVRRNISLEQNWRVGTAECMLEKLHGDVTSKQCRSKQYGGPPTTLIAGQPDQQYQTQHSGHVQSTASKHIDILLSADAASNLIRSTNCARTAGAQ